MIIDHNNLMYRKQWMYAKDHRFNGAYYYSKEIVKNIIPRVKTSRDWVTINSVAPHVNHAIVFVHNNINPAEHMRWLAHSRDIILVCGVPETMKKVAHLGIPIYIPLSVDVDFVSKFKTAKTKDTAYVGRPGKPGTKKLPTNIDYLSGMDREMLLREMAKYRKVYAVGRCAVEAKILGCEVLPYDPRFPDTSVWRIIDNKDAAKMLQDELDKIDNKGGKKDASRL